MNDPKVGDNVAYSVQWLASVGLSHSESAHDRGVITELVPIGQRQLAVVDWQGDSPQRVLLGNLAKVGPNRKFCQC